MIAGFGIGILVAVAFFAIIILVDEKFVDWDIKTDKKYLTKFGKISIIIAVVVLCLSTFVGARVHIRMFESEVRRFEIAKATYSEAIKSEDISGLERIEIVNKIVEENKILSKLKYDATKWYYFYLPDNLVGNLEPIRLN